MKVSYAGTTYLPKDGLPRWENFPYLEIAEQNGTRKSLGAAPGWEADPYGIPESPELRYVKFVAEGPDAREAIEAIKDVLATPPPTSKLGAAAGSFTGMSKYLSGNATPAQRYRPSGYRPAGVDNKLSEKADRMEREREEIRKRWERRGGVLGRRGT